MQWQRNVLIRKVLIEVVFLRCGLPNINDRIIRGYKPRLAMLVKNEHHKWPPILAANRCAANIRENGKYGNFFFVFAYSADSFVAEV